MQSTFFMLAIYLFPSWIVLSCCTQSVVRDLLIYPFQRRTGTKQGWQYSKQTKNNASKKIIKEGNKIKNWGKYKKERYNNIKLETHGEKDGRRERITWKKERKKIDG